MRARLKVRIMWMDIFFLTSMGDPYTWHTPGIQGRQEAYTSMWDPYTWHTQGIKRHSWYTQGIKRHTQVCGTHTPGIHTRHHKVCLRHAEPILKAYTTHTGIHMPHDGKLSFGIHVDPVMYASSIPTYPSHTAEFSPGQGGISRQGEHSWCRGCPPPESLHTAAGTCMVMWLSSP